jgi:hypothetical protein
VAMALGSNVAILVILIAGKTLLDLSLHLNEREKNARAELNESPEPIMPDVISGEANPVTATQAASAPSHPPARLSSGD